MGVGPHRKLESRQNAAESIPMLLTTGAAKARAGRRQGVGPRPRRF
jgi:hypothetical protein